ncbi:MAG: response regulator, partial [Verrucomicrobiota bacterium]|nr:response regulator [Verrucomicrobiota bacterium]
MPSLSSTAGRSQPILLVEEYGALAMAFSSALRRVAPDHETTLARTLADAEIAAETSPPALLVIDVDPAPGGLVDFLERLKLHHPHTRVLVIAASTWRNLPRERIRPGALAFIGKPFEIAELSEVVRSLLAAEGAGREGGLRELDATDVVTLLCLSAATESIRVLMPGGETGELHVIGGELAHVATGEETGMRALQEMLRWRGARFVGIPRPEAAPRTMRSVWTEALASALREARRTEAPGDPPASDPPEPIATEGKKILVIDDTELLLVFVEEILRGSSPQSTITTALSGEDGLRQVLREPPDLILLDYSLPDIHGDEVCRRL